MSTHMHAFTGQWAGFAGQWTGFSQWAIDPSGAVSLQAGWSPQVVATVGMLALALLGGAMLVRDRLWTERSFVPDPEMAHEEFRTDREVVCDLVRENGGRIKQSEIVASVDWSKAKVSRLLAELEDDGRVTKLRLGRENLVCLPGHEPTTSTSTDATNTD